LRGEPDGNFQALDAKTGEELWRFQTGFGADAPPVVYDVDGEQYVAIATGGNQGTGSAYGDAVWSFSLKGQLGPLWPPPPPSTVAGPGGPISTGVDTVKMGDRNVEYSYFPARIRVKVGSTVTFTNVGDLNHTATALEKREWDTGDLAKGGSKAITFTQPGNTTLSVHHTPGCMGKSSWRNEPVLRLARRWASLSALHTVGRLTDMPAVSGAEAMQQPLVLRVVMLVLLGAASFSRPEGRLATAAERLPPAEGALQVLITTSELVVGQNRFAFGLLQHNKLLDDASVTVRVYDIRDQQAQLTAETPGPLPQAGGRRAGEPCTRPSIRYTACAQ
jgi:plastocyanin